MGIDVHIDNVPIPIVHPKPLKSPTESGFILVGESHIPNYRTGGPDSVEFRPGASNDRYLKELEERGKLGITNTEKTKDETDAEWSAHIMKYMFQNGDTFSKTLTVRSNGTFETTRTDGAPATVEVILNTPEKFYQTAKEIQQMHSDWRFEFNVDLPDHRFTYTVTKVIPEKK